MCAASGVATGSPAPIILLADRLLRAPGVVVFLLGGPEDDFSIKRDSLQHDVVALAVLVRKRGPNGRPPIILIVAAFMVVATFSSPQSPIAFRRYLASKPLSFWIMTWFLFELVVLTAVGTFFRGPGWSWVWPWSE